MGKNLSGKDVAILVTDGFEQIELTEPKEALEQAGAKAYVVAPARENIAGKWQVKAWKSSLGEWGKQFDVDVPLDEAQSRDFDALLLPGGVMSADKLRMSPDAVRFVREFLEANKPVAAICHGPAMLIEAGVVRGRNVTSYPSLKTDSKSTAAWRNSSSLP